MVTRVVVAQALAVGVLGLLVSAGVSLPSPFSPLVHRLLHVAGVIVFVGNVVVGALLLGRADAHGVRDVDRFVSHTIQLADAVFTGPGILLLLYNGAALAQPYGGVWSTRWLRLSWLAFMLAGLIWAIVLVPLQHRLIVLSSGSDRGPWLRTARVYTVPGITSLLLISVVLILMVLKPT